MKIQATIATLIVAVIATAGALAYVVGGGIFAGEATAMPANGAETTSRTAPATDAATVVERDPIKEEALDEDSHDTDTDTVDSEAADSEAAEATTEAESTDATPSGDEATSTDDGTDSAPTDGAIGATDGATDTTDTTETTEPAPPATPDDEAATPSCPAGAIYDADTGMCHEVTIAPPLCAPGYAHDVHGDCVSICPDGWVYDIDAATCFEVTIAPPFCIDGHVLNEAGDNCVPKICPLTHVLNDVGDCELVEFHFCEPGFELVGLDCLAPCPAGSYRLPNSICAPNGLGTVVITCPPGETLVGSTCIGLNLDPVVTPQVNPDLLPDIPEAVTQLPVPVLPAPVVTIPPINPVFVPGLVQVPGL